MLCMEVVDLQTKRNIAATLRKAKAESGKSMEEFAAGFDLRKSTIQGYMNMKGEDDDANPTVVSLDQIAAGLNMTVAQLVSDPYSLRQYPLECAECMRMPAHSLHPKLRKPAELLLELFCSLSQLLYEIDDHKRP